MEQTATATNSKPKQFDIFADLTSLKIDDIQRHIIMKLYSAKYMIADIADVTGISDRTIFRILAQNNIETKKGNKRKSA